MKTLEYPSAGSVFRRPEGHFVGKLIDDCGLRGYSIGGAQISEKHSGFIINKGNATSQNVKDLILHIQETVKPEWCSRALEKSADSFSKIAYRIQTHIIYIFGRIMEVTFA